MTKRELYNLLDHWHFLQISDDIVNCPDNTKEFQSYVKACLAANVNKALIPQLVLGMLLIEAIKEESSLIFKIKSFFMGLFK